MTAQIRGADLLTDALDSAGIRHIFSLSGNQIMPIYDAALDANIAITHVRHEGACVHMADAWGRLTGVPGIAMVTGGPGHANAIGALYTALAAESPLVLLSGHAPLEQLGTDAFQEMRQADIASPCTKASWTAQDPKSLGRDIARAIRIARSGRPGPVHVSLPFDVLEARVSQQDALQPSLADFSTRAAPLGKAAARAVLREIVDAQRPIVICGPATANERGRIARASLVQAQRIPVLCMESPRGVNDPSLGAVAEVLAEADLVVLIGKRLDFTLRFGRSPAFAADCKFVQIDPDADAFERAIRATGNPDRIVFSAIADPYSALAALTEAAPDLSNRDRVWLSEVESACHFRPSAWQTAAGAAHGPLHPAEVGRSVQRAIDRAAEAILVVDGGEFGQWAQACVSAPCRIINGPAGSIGSAIPFALAAKIARPLATVFAMLGDGTFGFHMAEFDTAVRQRLPFVAVIGNDACWNAEHQIQLNSYGPNRTFGCELLPARYDQAIVGLGGHGEFVAQAADLDGALTRAIRATQPACVNVLVERLAAPNVSRKGSARPAGAH